ncbi:hypothetical protein PDE_02374 [Penicillium oxalicum 114-2]|uniref:Uncharacterized protein n=1 Tax=Penicillium oxalicum (strain 114-2 / CGMCC 5302) TaxID=933388 RepID=S7ZFK4_PENO1|nr:hypothetical protein PDE_02374 [Penicillium oxalicum 114-2]
MAIDVLTTPPPALRPGLWTLLDGHECVNHLNFHGPPGQISAETTGDTWNTTERERAAKKATDAIRCLYLSKCLRH